MSRPGLPWMHAFTQAADKAVQRFAALPAVWRESFLPLALASAPLLVGSAYAPSWMLPLLLVLTAVLLYQTAQTTERFMFQLDKVRAHLAITMPLCGFISVWGIALALAGRREVMLSVVGPYGLLLLLVCAPAYRLSQARTQRRVPLHYSFSAFACCALLASLSAL